MSRPCNFCDDPVIWKRTAFDHWMPLNTAHAVVDHDMVLEKGNGQVVVRDDRAIVLRAGMMVKAGELLHKAHFATCPRSAGEAPMYGEVGLLARGSVQTSMLEAFGHDVGDPIAKGGRA